MIHDEGGYVDLSWSPPNFPVDTLGVTYDVQRRPRGGSWRSLPSVEGAVTARRISFADLPPVGVRTGQTFRVRSVHNGRRSAWVESDGNLTTWNAPKPFRIVFAGEFVHTTATDTIPFVRFIATALDDFDSHQFTSYTFSCELSVGDRRNYAPNPQMVRNCGNVQMRSQELSCGTCRWEQRRGSGLRPIER